MALRPLGLPAVPPIEDPALAEWLQDVKSTIEALPFSYFSTADGPNTSGVTAPLGTFGIEIGSSATKFWFKKEESSLTTGWSYFSTIDTP